MAVSIFDSDIFGKAFTTPEMRLIFSDSEYIRCIIQAEVALARAQEHAGLLPPGTSSEIEISLDNAKINVHELAESVLQIGRPIMGLVKQLRAQAGKNSEWVHFGASTYDIMDTARVLQIKKAISSIEEKIAKTLGIFDTLISDHGTAIMASRSNHMHSATQTFGLKIAVYAEEFMRHIDRLEDLKFRVLNVQLAGANGTLNSMGSRGVQTKLRFAEELELGSLDTFWHNARDGITELGQTLGLICSSIARIGQNAAHLQSTEIKEFHEAGERSRGQSTTLPHKNNPRSAEFTEAVARLGRQRATGLLETMAQEHDRHGGTYIAEWALLPEVCILTDTALSWLIDLLERLKIDEARMLSNIWDAGGIVMTENLVHALAEFMPKSQARLIVEDAAHEATTTCKPIIDVLTNKVEISQTIPQSILAEALDPKNSTVSSGVMVNKISTRLEKFVKKAK